MVTGNMPQPPGLFGVYLQVGDLHRSLSFYCDVLALEVVWNDGALAVLHSHRGARADSLVIVDEADVLRDEGEAYAARLRAAGVAVTTVRYAGITHDFMMLNPLSRTHATRAAIAQAISILRGALHGT